jgi:hypothetical protein
MRLLFPLHEPVSEHVSSSVHSFPSLQGWPLRGVWMHSPAKQLSSVHVSASSQIIWEQALLPASKGAMNPSSSPVMTGSPPHPAALAAIRQITAHNATNVRWIPRYFGHISFM